MFLVVTAQVAVQWHRGQWRLPTLQTADLAILLFFLWLLTRTLTQPLGEPLPGMPPTLMHLVNGYLLPFMLYFMLRGSKLDAAQLRPALLVLGLLAVYLSLTAILEILKCWGLVFPSIIADPSLGIHFGRARGPMLQSVRLGMVLLSCWTALAVYSVWLHPYARWYWVALAVGLPLACTSIFVTYTRSIWLGLAFVIGLLCTQCLQGLSRRVSLIAMLAGILLVGIVKGPDLIAFKREYSAAETRESTYMRAAFAYVSLAMIKDRPVAGYGFNQFQVYNRTYLSDRSTDVRLESIRGYVHHNSYLSLLVDLGLVGFSLYSLVLTSCMREAWALWRAQHIPPWARGLGLVAIAIGGVHLIQMAFHEVSFSAIENSFLFAAFGLVMAARTQYSATG